MAAALLSYSGRTLFEQGELQSETTFYPLRASAPVLPETRTRTQSNCGPGAGPPTPDTTPAPGWEPPAPSEGEDAARPQSFPGRILPRREDPSFETWDLWPRRLFRSIALLLTWRDTTASPKNGGRGPILSGRKYLGCLSRSLWPQEPSSPLRLSIGRSSTTDAITIAPLCLEIMEEFVFIDIWEFLFLLINGTKFQRLSLSCFDFLGRTGHGGVVAGAVLPGDPQSPDLLNWGWGNRRGLLGTPSGQGATQLLSNWVTRVRIQEIQQSAASSLENSASRKRSCSLARTRSLPVHLLGVQLFARCCGSADKESACNAGDLGSIPVLGRSPGEGKGYPL